MSGRSVQPEIPRALGPFFVAFQNFLARRRSAKILRGAHIRIFPAVVGWDKDPLVGVSLSIKVPRNFTLPRRVLVIKVFSSESVSLRDCRKVAMSFFRALAWAIVPHTPTSQSSAYLTYSILVCFGLGSWYLIFLRRLWAFLSSEGSSCFLHFCMIAVRLE